MTQTTNQPHRSEALQNLQTDIGTNTSSLVITTYDFLTMLYEIGVKTQIVEEIDLSRLNLAKLSRKIANDVIQNIDDETCRAHYREYLHELRALSDELWAHVETATPLIPPEHEALNKAVKVMKRRLEVIHDLALKNG